MSKINSIWCIFEFVIFEQNGACFDLISIFINLIYFEYPLFFPFHPPPLHKLMFIKIKFTLSLF